jgi:hypothetical protein
MLKDYEAAAIEALGRCDCGHLAVFHSTDFAYPEEAYCLECPDDIRTGCQVDACALGPDDPEFQRARLILERKRV